MNQKTSLTYQRFKFIGNQECFQTIEGSDILASKEYLNTNLKDKIIILGYIGEKIGITIDPFKEEDYWRSPLGDGKAPDMYGVIILANSISMLLNKTY